MFPITRYEFYENDFVKIYSNEKIEQIHMKNLFNKKKVKNLINSNIESNNNNLFDNVSLFQAIFFYKTYISNNIYNYTNKINKFCKYFENGSTIGIEYYDAFLQLLNNYSNDFQEDIEISIYDNLKEENNSKENNLSAIIDMINDYIKDEESKTGFLALLRQSFLLGKIRTNI